MKLRFVSCTHFHRNRWRVINRSERSPATINRGTRRASYNHPSLTMDDGSSSYHHTGCGEAVGESRKRKATLSESIIVKSGTDGMKRMKEGGEGRFVTLDASLSHAVSLNNSVGDALDTDTEDEVCMVLKHNAPCCVVQKQTEDLCLLPYIHQSSPQYPPLYPPPLSNCLHLNKGWSTPWCLSGNNGVA